MKVKSIDGHAVRMLVVSRGQLVGVRARLSDHPLGIMKTFGLVLGKSGGRA